MTAEKVDIGTEDRTTLGMLLSAEVSSAVSAVSAGLASAGLRVDQSAPLIDSALVAAADCASGRGDTGEYLHRLVIAEGSLAEAMKATAHTVKWTLITAMRDAQFTYTREAQR